MAESDSLVTALEAWFEKPLPDLPDTLRQRIQRDLFPLAWADLNPDQRRSAAQQWDYVNDPATQHDQATWWSRFADIKTVTQKIKNWEIVAAHSPSELAKKEECLEELRNELSRLEQHSKSLQHHKLKQQQSERDAQKASSNPGTQALFIAYPRALQILVDRLNATPEEMAAWILMGPGEGGLAAYLNANEMNPPPRFDYAMGDAGNFDYLSPIMACWFHVDDIAKFQPEDRFITGKALIERWGNRPGIQPEAFIFAKIGESRLLDIHPVYGLTQGSFPEDRAYPPLEDALFVQAHVENIEAEDFSGYPTDKTSSTTQQTSTEVGSPEWRKHTAQKAANTRHNKPGGSRDKKKQIRKIWATGKYSSRDICAEQECAALDMSFSAARKALRNTPTPESSG